MRYKEFVYTLSNNDSTVSCFDDYNVALSEGIKETIKILRDERID